MTEENTITWKADKQDEYLEILKDAEGQGQEKLDQDQAEALLASLGPEVAKYLQLNVVGDIAKMPIEDLRRIAMQAGAGRGVDLELGAQDNIGITAREVGQGFPVAEASEADLGNKTPAAGATGVAPEVRER